MCDDLLVPGAGQGAATFRAAPEAYDRLMGRYSAPLAAALIDATGVSPGDRVLDVGCGPGALTQALAARVGAERVAALDPSDSFAEECRRRVPAADVRVGAAEGLPFADDSFDAVLSQLVVNFLDEPGRALAEMSRVTRPGGLVAACVWDYKDGMRLLRVYWDAAVALRPQAREQDEAIRMRNCTPAELETLWTNVRFEDFLVGELQVETAYQDFEDCWTPFLAGVGPSGAYCASLDEPDREALRSECFSRLGSPRGGFTLTARAWFVSGRVPAA